MNLTKMKQMAATNGGVKAMVGYQGLQLRMICIKSTRVTRDRMAGTGLVCSEARGVKYV